MRKSPRIKDVPCGACVNGYGGLHLCQAPDHCPCDRIFYHLRRPEDMPKTHTRGQTEVGPDFCVECSDAVQEWVTWPCAFIEPRPTMYLGPDWSEVIATLLGCLVLVVLLFFAMVAATGAVR